MIIIKERFKGSDIEKFFGDSILEIEQKFVKNMEQVETDENDVPKGTFIISVEWEND